MSGAERLAARVDEDATIAQKAAEIYATALDLADLFEVLDRNGDCTGMGVAKRIAFTIECLAQEIEHDELRRTAPPVDVAQTAPVPVAAEKPKATKAKRRG